MSTAKTPEEKANKYFEIMPKFPSEFTASCHDVNKARQLGFLAGYSEAMAEASIHKAHADVFQMENASLLSEVEKLKSDISDMRNCDHDGAVIRAQSAKLFDQEIALNEATKENVNLNNDLTTLREQLKIAKGALEFYADHDNYAVTIDGHCSMFEDADDYPEDAKFGRAARESIEQIKALEGNGG